MPLSVLFEDDHYLCVEKPAGLAVHRSGLVRDAVTMVDLMQEAGYPVFPVHRLDKPVSGLMIWAKSSEAAARLQPAFHDRVQKTYWAVCRGWPQGSQMDKPLKKPTGKEAGLSSKSGQIIKNEVTRQAALTRYQVLNFYEIPEAVDKFPTTRYSLTAVQPITGRFHQIRRHFAGSSHHLIGDRVYGKGIHNRFFQNKFGLDQLLLRAVKLEFTHPFTEATLVLTAPSCSYWEDGLKKLSPFIKTQP